MAELRVAKFDDNLMARLKSKAALSRTTIRIVLEKLLTEAFRRHERRRIQAAKKGANDGR